MSRNLVIIVTLLVIVFYEDVAGLPSFYSFETSSNTIDDGNRVVSKMIERSLDTSKSVFPQTKQKVMVGPSQRRGVNNRIARQQVLSNNIGVGLENAPRQDIFRFFNGSFLRHGFLNKARTVQSPALSVDSGGKTSNSVTNGMAKLLNIKHGYYADIYDRMGKNTEDSLQ